MRNNNNDVVYYLCKCNILLLLLSQASVQRDGNTANNILTSKAIFCLFSALLVCHHGNALLAIILIFPDDIDMEYACNKWTPQNENSVVFVELKYMQMN